MMAKALEQRWPIKPEYRARIVLQLMKIIADPSSSAREVTAASKAVLAAEQQNTEEAKQADDFQSGRITW